MGSMDTYHKNEHKGKYFPLLSSMRNSTHDHEGPLPFCKQNRNDTFSIEMAVLTYVEISS